ncbi:hypothetical protein [Staphylococcus xylosus]|uniref:hypothetical protein n=1 Tax=Staphylococcus xylosus TaxID=1288 RepID=UPI00164287B1|nr:hypothetical protein [Staphylococcus xylosus]MEB7507578.1 hypothetical protein [Staphylococcus xylosus]
MKTILVSLGVILLVTILGVAIVFAYSSYKDLEVKKEETKNKENKKKDNQGQQTINSNKDTNNEDVRRAEEINSIEESKELNLEEEIAKADKDSDGLATTDEMTPELEEITRQGKFQPTSREITHQDEIKEEDKPVTDNEGNNINDIDSEEFISKYTEGMDEEEAQSVKDMAKDDSGYEEFLRGQVKARANGQGGNY